MRTAGRRGRRPGGGHVASLAVLGLPTVRVRELDGRELLAAPLESTRPGAGGSAGQ